MQPKQAVSSPRLPSKRGYTKWLLLLCVLSTISGCGALKSEPTYINVKPKLAPLSAEILQLMQPDSTEVSKKAEDWYKSSGSLLDSVTLPLKP